MTGLNRAAEELGRIGSGVSRLRTSRKLSCCCLMSLCNLALGPGTVGLIDDESSRWTRLALPFFADPKKVWHPFLIDLLRSIEMSLLEFRSLIQ